MFIQLPNLYLKGLLCSCALGLSGLLLLFLLLPVLTTMWRSELSLAAELTVRSSCNRLHGTQLDTIMTMSSASIFCWRVCLVACRIKVPYPFQWGTPIFRASSVFGMMGAALVSAAEVHLPFWLNLIPRQVFELNFSFRSMSFSIGVVIMILWYLPLMFVFSQQELFMLHQDLQGRHPRRHM